MIRRSKVSWKPKITAGRCPICKWWFDGYLVGGKKRTPMLNEVVEWAIDAQLTGRCLKNRCRIDNRYERPVLEQPPDSGETPEL